MGSVIIGKHTLESLTSGMYSDPYVVFREYIQNSADAIDGAVSGGILPAGRGLIHITLAPGEGRLSFSDNGTGIPADQAERTLISIGNSRKSARTDRGFRVCGYDRVGEQYGVPLCDLKKDRTRTVDTPLRPMEICCRALDADLLIDLPVLKGHCQTRMTCALKNCKGCLPDREKRRFHAEGLM